MENPIRITNQALDKRAAALSTEIREAFAGVSRTGGRSWSVAVAADGHFAFRSLEDALAQDTDTSWEQVLADPKWCPNPGVGGFCFLDPIGRRYYLPPAMCWGLVHPEHPETLAFEFANLEFDDCTRDQLLCCIKYMEIMNDRALLVEEGHWPFFSEQWKPLLARFNECLQRGT